MTGTAAVSRTKSISRRDPRGITTSIIPTAPSISAVAWRSLGSRVTISGSHPMASSSRRMISTAALLVSAASWPPLSTVALPALAQRANTSNVTLGLASYITPITPNGTDTLRITIPLGRVTDESSLPRGDGRAATARMSRTMSAMRCSVRSRRSARGSAGSMRDMSDRLASSRAEALRSIDAATRSSISSISCGERRASWRDARRECCKSEVIDIMYICC